MNEAFRIVLNLIITGIPSIRPMDYYLVQGHMGVLNLIITGIPSILCLK